LFDDDDINNHRTDVDSQLLLLLLLLMMMMMMMMMTYLQISASQNTSGPQTAEGTGGSRECPGCPDTRPFD